MRGIKRGSKGNPMIPVNEPLLGTEEKELLNRCIDTGWISSEGPFVEEFEKKIAALSDRKYGVALSSGSAALDVAVRAAEIGEGDEVIMPAFTIISPAASVVRMGGVPVLVDSDPLTWNMDISHLEEKITPRTKAIIAVHIYGLPVDMGPLLDIAKKHNLAVIEDAAEMHGQKYGGKPCGSFGDLSVFSFYPNKHITTGEGGMVVTDDGRLAEKCRSLRNLCFKPEKRFVHDELGWNYRMTNLQAALGVAQAGRLEEVVKRKRAMGRRYRAGLKDVPGLQLPLERTDYAENIYWVYGLLLKEEVPFNAEEAMARLKEKEIGTRPFFWPMHWQPVFNRLGLFRGESYPVSENLAGRGFYLPSGAALTGPEIDKVVHAVREILK